MMRRPIAVFGGIGLIVVLFLLVLDRGAGQTAAPVANRAGRVLPPDAAPLAQQVFRYMFREPSTLDISVAAYEADGTYFAFERLLLLDEHSQLVPGAADRWEASKDGRTWTFHLRPRAKWSDGRSVTARDFVYSFRRMLDPASGNIYAFLYYVIKGGKAFNQGQSKDVNTVGVRAVDEDTFVIETEGPCPYLPYVVAFITSSPVPRWQVERFGKKWTEPGNCVSNFTYRLAEWAHGSSMTFDLDPNYNGRHKAYMNSIIVKFVGSQRPGTLPYENDEVDAYLLDPLDYARAKSDPTLRGEVYHVQNFETWYLFFQTQKPPFNDRRLRQAIGHAIDRDSLCRSVLNGLGVTAYTMLPPGFPGYAGEQLRAFQRYDPALARRLLAEAGYPAGKGFPATELWLRVADTNINKVAAEAIQGMLKQTLGITVQIRYQERKLFNDNLYQWKIPMGMLAFAYDYPDPSNMLGLLWRSQPIGYARHDWKHAEFDRLVDAANTEMATARRYDLYTQAERILADDAGAVFLFHSVTAELRKPWVKGMKKNKLGQHVPLMSVQTVNFPDLYIGKKTMNAER